MQSTHHYEAYGFEGIIECANAGLTAWLTARCVGSGMERLEWVIGPQMSDHLGVG